jgi:hypothetical protein
VVTREGSVYLDALTSLPPGVEFKNKRDVDLRSLTSISPGVEFKNGGDVYLESLIGGWFAQYITPILIDNLNVDVVHNYDIDKDAQLISYKFNRRYKEQNKYQSFTRNVFIKPLIEHYDMIINTSCEHMYHMKKFKELNPALNPIYILQSTNDTKYDDHINCVNSTEELTKQADLKEIYFSGSKVLDNGMTRFMVIGK